MPQLGGTRLRHEPDRVPLWRGNHVGLEQLAEDMARYLYCRGCATRTCC
jgi:hypothetical protein